MINLRIIIKFTAYVLGLVIPIAMYEPKLFTLTSIWLALFFAGAFGAFSEAGGVLDEPTKVQVFFNGALVIFYTIIFYSIIYPVIEKGVQPFFGPFIISFSASISSVGWFLIPIGGIVALSANELNLSIENESANK